MLCGKSEHKQAHNMMNQAFNANKYYVPLTAVLHCWHILGRVPVRLLRHINQSQMQVKLCMW